MNPFTYRLTEQLHTLSCQGRQRNLFALQPKGATHLTYQNREYLNLASNDYLGLAGNQDLLRKFYSNLEQKQNIYQYRLGSGASRLMTGNHIQYNKLERGLARYYHKDRALIFTSGYHINIGLLPALAQKGDLILADKLCHASLLDGMRLSQAKMIRYPHLDYDRLEQLLRKHSSGLTAQKKQTIFVVTESLFSMDGDYADLSILVRLKEQYGAVLYVDEAHAVGVRGLNGLGLAEEQGVTKQIDLLVGTFGKAWGGQGAFVVCEETIYIYLVNTARSLIFTTALPPVNIHWLNFILPLIPTMNRERQQLHTLTQQLSHGLQEQGLATCGNSHILPIMIGNEAQTVNTAKQLQGQGFWVQAIRTPTVPRGTARLRLSLTAALQAKQLTALPKHIAKAIRQSTRQGTLP
ncbi:MAG: 8-amino-7-oxononanoate synthase [Candidatus Electrothrix sp. AX2]|nr:8-amino-7-oxononanoate synthase [Candidatus Electrothrix gigas]